MGVYTDDFAISTGILSPHTTLLAFLALLIVTITAWRLRHKVPAFAFGWGFFLLAHSLEAGIIPLELYFEHRNYLPSVGLLLALVALATHALQSAETKGIRIRRIAPVLVVGSLLVLAFCSHGRAGIWRSEQTIAESSLLAHPHSLRANVAVMTSSLKNTDYARARNAVDNLLGSDNPRTRALAHAYRLMIECELDHKGRPNDLQYVIDQTPMPLTLYEQQPFELLFHIVRKQACTPFKDADFGNAMRDLADRSYAAGPRGGNHFYLRYLSAAYLSRAGDWPAALRQGRLSWLPGLRSEAAVPLLTAQLQLGDLIGARQTLSEMHDRSDPDDVKEQAMLRYFSKVLTATENQE
jgi:hypothetical protein